MVTYHTYDREYILSVRPIPPQWTVLPNRNRLMIDPIHAKVKYTFRSSSGKQSTRVLLIVFDVSIITHTLWGLPPLPLLLLRWLVSRRRDATLSLTTIIIIRSERRQAFIRPHCCCRFCPLARAPTASAHVWLDHVFFSLFPQSWVQFHPEGGKVQIDLINFL